MNEVIYNILHPYKQYGEMVDPRVFYVSPYVVNAPNLGFKGDAKDFDTWILEHVGYLFEQANVVFLAQINDFGDLMLVSKDFEDCIFTAPFLSEDCFTTRNMDKMKELFAWMNKQAAFGFEPLRTLSIPEPVFLTPNMTSKMTKVVESRYDVLSNKIEEPVFIYVQAASVGAPVRTSRGRDYIANGAYQVDYSTGWASINFDGKFYPIATALDFKHWIPLYHISTDDLVEIVRSRPLPLAAWELLRVIMATIKYQDK